MAGIRNPREVQDLLDALPEGWEDDSWIHDSCDSLTFSSEDGATTYTIWIIDPKHSDGPGDEDILGQVVYSVVCDNSVTDEHKSLLDKGDLDALFTVVNKIDFKEALVSSKLDKDNKLKHIVHFKKFKKKD